MYSDFMLGGPDQFEDDTIEDLEKLGLCTRI